MCTLSINQRFKRIKIFDCFDFFVFSDQLRSDPYILPQQRSMKNWQRLHCARSHGNNSISCFVRMPQCITKSKDKSFLIVWLISSHRKARQVAVLIFKLRHRSFYSPKCLSVGWSVRGKNFKFKQSKFFDYFWFFD